MKNKVENYIHGKTGRQERTQYSKFKIFDSKETFDEFGCRGFARQFT
jgi:hypothetical protein